MKQFYIYVHCRPSGEPFYVGKGYGNRAHYFSYLRNKHHKHVVAKHGKENILVYTRNCKSESHAHANEKWMIAWCRAQGFRMTNMTDGGEGVSGWTTPVKLRRKIAIRMLGNTNSEGNVHSTETREKIAIKLTGNKNCLGKKLPKRSAEHCEKISKNNKGNKYRLGNKASEETLVKLHESHIGLSWSVARRTAYEKTLKV
jgi:hypothetical protein